MMNLSHQIYKYPTLSNVAIKSDEFDFAGCWIDNFFKIK